jgi:hypothetical protein
LIEFGHLPHTPEVRRKSIRKIGSGESAISGGVVPNFQATKRFAAFTFLPTGI